MKYGICVLMIFGACFFAGCSGRAVKNEFSPKEQAEAAGELVRRMTGSKADSFRIAVTGSQYEGKDYFSLYSDGNHIVLEGNDGVSVASALNYYLTEYCGWHYTWCGEDTALPEKLPVPEERIFRTSPYKFRYYLNYCTFNYSMSWWDESRWQREIDWMAMNGINLPLAVTGQNSVWQRVYRRLGFTDAELESFFSGPAYSNWFWMGNLDGWGGPLPQNFMDRQEKLQKYILRAERSLGMKPVLPAFTGHVPPAFAGKFPETMVKTTSWSNFAPVNVLDPEEEMFTEIGRMFLEEQTRLYGTNHYYTADTFNENEPPVNDSLYLNDVSTKVYRSMSGVDPDAVWVMQGWMFYYDRNFWGNKQIRALLDAVPDDKMLILDLWSERFPVWNRTEAYYGKPWIWCMLQNFGQNTNMSGNVTSVANDPSAALASHDSGRMAGIGMTMEGIGHTPVMYALMSENVWRDKAVDVDSFLKKYLSQRYGTVSQDAFDAWRHLFDTVFENTVNNGGPESVVCARPTFNGNPRGTINTAKCYELKDLVYAWDRLVSLAEDCSGRDGFRYDLVDVSRQVLADYASVLHKDMADAFNAGDCIAFASSSASFLELIEDMDRLVATREEFSLGKWLEAAKAMGDNDKEKSLYEWNARCLITMWGDRECSLHDYACRQWSGLLNGFYLPRWKMFCDEAAASLALGNEFIYKDFEEKCKDWETGWLSGKETYPSEACGDEIEECLRIYGKYSEAVRRI